MNTKETQKQQARNLYFHQNLPQTQIAETIGVERKTIHRWATEGRWQEMKLAAQQMPGMLLQDLYNQLSCLHARIQCGPAAKQYPNEEESLIQRRLIMSIKNVERQSVGNYMQIFTELINEIAKESETLANLIAPYTDKILQKKLDKKSFRKHSMFINDEPEEQETTQNIDNVSSPSDLPTNKQEEKKVLILPNDPPCDISENLITQPTEHSNEPTLQPDDQKNFPENGTFTSEAQIYKLAIYNNICSETPTMSEEIKQAWHQWYLNTEQFDIKEVMNRLKNNLCPPILQTQNE